MPSAKSKVTIYDVAEKASVAISTVSRVLNNSPDVSDHTRAKVAQAIEDLQFRPDRTAKNLALKKAQSLAIAIPTFTTPFHNELLKGVRSRMFEGENDLLLFDLGSTSPVKTLLNFLERGTVDGLLLAGVPVDEQLSAVLQTLHAPVVLVGNHHTEFDSYCWDDEAGARAAVSHLVEQGHRRIGVIRAYSDSYFQTKRIKGYHEAMHNAGLEVDPAFIQSGQTEKHAGFSEEDGYEAMHKLLKLAPAITAVFANSDVQAIGALKAIRDAGKTVPDDVAVVGYDDIKTSKFIGLSSVDQNMEGVGQRATEQLLKRVHGTAPILIVEELCKPQLRVRESSDYRVV